MEPSFKKIDKICKAVLKLSVKDLENVSIIVEKQAGFLHPLKHKKASKIHEAGNHNQRVLMAIQRLKIILESYENEKYS